MKNAVLRNVMYVVFVRTDVSEELTVSVIRLTRIRELGIALAGTSNRPTLRRNTSSRFLVNLKADALCLRNFGSYKSHAT
jgi:hypothetical protein